MDGLPCLIGLIVCTVGIFVVLSAQNKAQDAAEAAARQALQDAEGRYHTALRNLKSEPTKADLKQRALEFGRAYAALTRQDNNVTVFDEVALSNDISAATAGATVTNVAATPPSSTCYFAPSPRARRWRQLKRRQLPRR